MSQVITTSTRDAVCYLTLNRPSAYNAMNLELLSHLLIALETAQDPSVRAVVLRAEGKAFCAGGDVKAFEEQLKQGSIDLAIPLTLHRCIALVRELKKPVIAQVQGACAGAGLSLALACDLTIASDQAVFSLAYSGIGLSADGGSTYFLPRLIGLKRALELYLLAERLDAHKALEYGLINRVYPHAELYAMVESLATGLAQGPTLAFARTKALLSMSDAHNLRTQLDLETLGVSEIALTQDFKEGVLAFVGKRQPAFLGG